MAAVFLVESSTDGKSANAGGYLGGAYREGWARILGCLAAMNGGQA
jgi:hypothetical protein